MQCLVTKLNVKINSTKLQSFLTPILEYDTNTYLLKMYSSNGASIYYTLDGSTPTTSSTLYTEPFEITSSTLKVIAVKNSNTTSVPTLSVVYNEIDETMSMNSDYPILMSTNNGTFTPIENNSSIDIVIGNKYTIKTNNEISAIGFKN